MNTKHNNYILYNNITNNMLTNVKLYHQGFRHKNIDTISKLLNIKIPSSYNLDYIACIKAKLANNISKEITIKPKDYLQKVVMDLCGPITPNSREGFRYIIFFLDAATRFLDFKLLKNKSEAFKAFQEFKIKVEKQSNYSIKSIGSDNGLEFKNKLFKDNVL